MGVPRPCLARLAKANTESPFVASDPQEDLAEDERLLGSALGWEHTRVPISNLAESSGLARARREAPLSNLALTPTPTPTPALALAICGPHPTCP